MIYLWFTIIVIACYFIGSVNFARILAWKRRNQDITTKGSHNPGTMNMLRVYGFKIAVATLILEFIKGGVPALIAGLVMEHFYPGMFYVAYLTAGLSATIGQIFPAIYKFKGGKGLGTCAGVLFFSPLWWIGIILFAVNWMVLYYTDYASVATLSFITELGIATTIYLTVFKTPSLYFALEFANVDPYYWISIILLWTMIGLVFISHRKNIYRLIHKSENKANFKKSLKSLFKKNGKEEEVENQATETEVKNQVVENENSTK